MNRGIDKGLNGEAVRSVLDILLFAVNFAGIVGALSETLLADWRGGFHQPFFWGGLALISGAAGPCRAARDMVGPGIKGLGRADREAWKGHTAKLEKRGGIRVFCGGRWGLR